MIWVIGDIHGMSVLLDRILFGISQSQIDVEPVEKLIFIGDYIDHGPDSKKVMDTIMGLKFKKICLAGNHEDMALKFINQNQNFLKEWGNQWFNNGAIATYRSIYAPEDIPASFWDGYDYSNPFHAKKYEGREVPSKYVNFLGKLRYSYRQVIDAGGKKIAFTFFHGLPRTDQTLKTQLIKTYAEYIGYMETEFDLEDTTVFPYAQFDDNDYRWRKRAPSVGHNLLWGRYYNYRFGYNGEVIVHGHTPTILLRHSPLRLEAKELNGFMSLYDRYWPELCLPFLFSRGKRAGYVHRFPKKMASKKAFSPGTFRYDCGRNGAVEAINVDTGAVCRGGALTAIGLSGALLAQGQIRVLSAFTSSQDGPVRGERSMDRSVPEESRLVSRTISFDKIGLDPHETHQSHPFLLFPGDMTRSGRRKSPLRPPEAL